MKIPRLSVIYCNGCQVLMMLSNLLYGICLVNELDDGSCGNCLALIVNQNVFVLVRNIYIDDCLRSFKV